METDYSWRKCDGKSICTGRCVERATRFSTEAFHVGARVVPLIYPGQEEIVFISNGTSPRASLENAFSPLILAQGGEGLSVGPRCDVISFVRRVRLGLIVILEVAMVGRYSVP